MYSGTIPPTTELRRCRVLTHNRNLILSWSLLDSTNYKVLLINPPVLAVLEPWYDTPSFGRVGLAYVAAYLRQSRGFDVRILDAKFERLDFQQVLEQVIQWQPDLVGFTAFTNEIKPAAYQAGLIKRA